MSRGPLDVHCQVSPPVTQTTASGAPSNILVEVRSGTLGPPIGLELKIARVGRSGDRGLPVLPDAFQQLLSKRGAKDSFIFAGRDGTGAARAGPEPEHALRSPWPDLASALNGLRSIIVGMDEGRLVWGLVIVETPVVEATPATLQAIQGLLDVSAGVDLVCTHPGADLGLLGRLAQRTGGELLHVRPVDLAAQVSERVSQLRDQRVRDVRLTLSNPPGVQIQRIFRVHPTPAFIGIPADAQGQIELRTGPVGGERNPAWLISANTQPRRLGTYRLFEIGLSYEAGGVPMSAQTTAVQTVVATPPRRMQVAAAVTAAHARVETAAWVEEIARAFRAGEARRVAGLLDRLVRHAVTLEERALVERVFELRMGFLRGGTLDAAELNLLRRQIAQVG